MMRRCRAALRRQTDLAFISTAYAESNSAFHHQSLRASNYRERHLAIGLRYEDTSLAICPVR